VLEKLSKREKNLVFLLIGVALAALLYTVIIEHQLPYYRNAKENLELERRALDEGMESLRGAKDIEEKNKELVNKLAEVQQSFNKEVQSGINYYFIGKHAIDQHVIVTEVAPLPLGGGNNYITLPLNVKVRGLYENVLKYIQLVEQDMPNTSELRSLEMKPVEGGENMKGDLPLIEAGFNIVTYVTKSPQSLQLAQQFPLGRFDIFAPLVDLPDPKVLPQEEESNSVIVPPEAADAEENPSVSPPADHDVPQTAFPLRTYTNEKEPYRFPQRLDREKEGGM
jgi:Tfp pilus assembly protein PilO